ncbi:DNA repair protein RecO [Candidatus Uhrbacteria bacterium]|nr:DNA repair protein RecO [Candidatus Uhrbacteria bacterium]
MTYAATGIMLRRRDIGEWDRWYTVLTREHGKLAFVGKGTRRPRAKLAAHLEPYSSADLVLARGRTTDRITFARVTAPGTRFAASWSRMCAAAFVVECVDVLTRDAHRDVGLFEFLETALDAIAGDQSGCMIPASVRLLSILGYTPELDRCVECRAVVPPGIIAAAPIRGGALCGRCRGRHADVVTFRAEDRVRIAQCAAAFVPGATSSAVDAFVQAQLLSHLPGPLRSLPELTSAVGARMVSGS